MPGSQAAPTMTTGSSSLAAEVRQAYARTLLSTAEPELIHAQFCDKYPVPEGQGNTINMNRFELLTPTTTPLTEGVVPNGSNITATRVPISVLQYGDFIPYSDLVLTESIDPLLEGIVKRQGEQSGRTVEWLTRGMMSTGTVVRYANGKTARNTLLSTDVINEADIKKVVRTLKKNFARKRTMKGKKCYICIITPDVEFDLQAVNTFLAVSEYSNPDAIFEGEIGMLYGVRFITSTEAMVFAGQGSGGADVHSSVFFGMEAFGASELSKQALTTINQPLGSAGSLDPLRQVGSQGWKLTWGGTILNQLYVCRYESGVSS